MFKEHGAESRVVPRHLTPRFCYRPFHENIPEKCNVGSFPGAIPETRSYSNMKKMRICFSAAKSIYDTRPLL